MTLYESVSFSLGIIDILGQVAQKAGCTELSCALQKVEEHHGLYPLDVNSYPHSLTPLAVTKMSQDIARWPPRVRGWREGWVSLLKNHCSDGQLEHEESCNVETWLFFYNKYCRIIWLKCEHVSLGCYNKIAEAE